MIIRASVFWRNDRPDGLGFTLCPPAFSPEELTELFMGDTMKKYMRDSDENLGTNVVDTYLAQLGAIAAGAKVAPMPLQQVILATLNIIWLSERGFIPNDDFNGVLLVHTR